MSTMPESSTLSFVLEQFFPSHQCLEIERIDNGHIHETLSARLQTPHGTQDVILQRMNQHVFPQPEQVMENILLVTRHLQESYLAEGQNPEGRVLHFFATPSGEYLIRDSAGEVWRAAQKIPNARTYETTQDFKILFEVAWAFGDFQRRLISLEGMRLHETIPQFHHTRKRFNDFIQAVEQDAYNRALSVRQEIEYLQRREDNVDIVADALAKGHLPSRVTHNDTKINNVLMDRTSGNALCVIDLDTVMPGSILYDFGDLVRSAANTALEDEKDLSRVHFDIPRFIQLARGFLSAVREMLTPLEWELLAFAPRLITLEQALRFLTDYLQGDVYYRTAYPQHNLHRSRTQIRLLQEMEQQAGLMESILERCKTDTTLGRFS